MNALAIHLYLTIRHINLSFNYFGNFYRIIESKHLMRNDQEYHNDITAKAGNKTLEAPT